MTSRYLVASLCFIALLVGINNARKEPGQSSKDKESHCHTSADAVKGYKAFVTDFEPRPSASAYVDALKHETDEASITAYVDARKSSGDKAFVTDFEPRPSASAYVDALKSTGDKAFVTDFEPRPSASSYDNALKREDDGEIAF